MGTGCPHGRELKFRKLDVTMKVYLNHLQNMHGCSHWPNRSHIKPSAEEHEQITCAGRDT